MTSARPGPPLLVVYCLRRDMEATAEPVAPAEAGDFKALSKDEQRCV